MPANPADAISILWFIDMLSPALWLILAIGMILSTYGLRKFTNADRHEND